MNIKLRICFGEILVNTILDAVDVLKIAGALSGDLTEINIDDMMLVQMLTIVGILLAVFSCGERQIVKQVSAVYGAAKESADHVCHDGFPKAARSCNTEVTIPLPNGGN